MFFDLWGLEKRRFRILENPSEAQETAEGPQLPVARVVWEPDVEGVDMEEDGAAATYAELATAAEELAALLPSWEELVRGRGMD